jgi:periplasmic divalent cation tolerance protein
MNNCNEFLSESNSDIVLGQTTFSTKNDANLIAQALLDKELIACAQIEGPISSKYIWKGKPEQSKEWKVTLKFNEDNINSVTESLINLHPYENPEWVYWKARSTHKYANWVENPK